MTPAAAILDRAREIIETRGWVQGHFSLPNKKDENLPGPVCLARAINDAAKELGASEDERWSARDAVIALIGTPSIASWNDRGKTTKQDVLRVLKDAIGS